LRAAIAAGWKTIPARLREADDRLVAELAIVENLQRKDLNAIEKALSFRRYIDQHSCTQDDLARRLKMDRSTIANLMRLLELPSAVQDALRDGQISAGHARALLPLGDESEQIDFSKRIHSEGISVREIERLVSERISRDGLAIGFNTARPRVRNPNVEVLEQEIKMALGTKVKIRSANGKGSIVVYFNNHDEFERLRAALKVSLAARQAA
jgi:ParB family chromosome partitioning protein